MASVLKSDFPPVKRYITAHDPTTGKSVISTLHSPTSPQTSFPNGSMFTLDYLTTTHPISFSSDADLITYTNAISSPHPLPPHFVTPAGTVIRHTETPPGGISPMHRTLTLDYMVVLDGEVELILDSGEKKILNRGDTVIQRGTMHAWRNCSKTEWARMLAVMMPAEALEINGKILEEKFLAPPVPVVDK